MPWWNRIGSQSKLARTAAFESTSLSSSSPQQQPRPPDHKALGMECSEAMRQRQLTRQKKIRRLKALDVEGLKVDVGEAPPLAMRSASVRAWPTTSSMMMPQPLPRPEESTMGGTPCAACRCSHLNSPGGGRGRKDGKEARLVYEQSYPPVEHVGERFSAATSVGSKATYRIGRKDADTTDKRSNGKNHHQDPCTSESANFRLNVPPKSAPSSGFSSPLISPRKISTADFFSSPLVVPTTPAVWSAPEFPSKDMTTFSSPSPVDMFFPNSDRSLLQSPNTRNPGAKHKNPNFSSPPRAKFGETANSWRDSSGIASVHPLPLPPGTVLPNQSPPSVHQNAAKNEAGPVQSLWQKGKLIGRGTFGNVYVGTNRHTGALCAMKEVNLIPDDPKSAECIKQLEQEIILLSQLKHPNIVQYYGSEIVDDRFYIYLEYVYPGSINKYVQEHYGAITESVVRNFTRHILTGLAYLHSKRTMHRDVKGANLLVDANAVVKLADFGMAKHLSGASSVLSLKGTPHWMAPEVIQPMPNQNAGYDLAVDIWSLGCTIIEIFTGKHPWQGYEGAAAMFKVLQASPCIPESLSAEGKDFLQQCFRRNPAERPTASQLLEHPFIRNAQHHELRGSGHSFPSLANASLVPAPFVGEGGSQFEASESRVGAHISSPQSTPPRTAPPSTSAHRNPPSSLNVPKLRPFGVL